jgi:hypothetical protein
MWLLTGLYSFGIEVKRWLSQLRVECIIVLKFYCGDLVRPDKDHPLPTNPADRATFGSALSPGLGPISFDGFIWGPKINKITVTVYVRDHEVCDIGWYTFYSVPTVFRYKNALRKHSYVSPSRYLRRD